MFEGYEGHAFLVLTIPSFIYSQAAHEPCAGEHPLRVRVGIALRSDRGSKSVESFDEPRMRHLLLALLMLAAALAITAAGASILQDTPAPQVRR